MSYNWSFVLRKTNPLKTWVFQGFLRENGRTLLPKKALFSFRVSISCQVLLINNILDLE